MRYTSTISAALLLALSQLQPAAAQAVNNLVSDAVTALGGADALRALKTVSISGEAKYWEPGQSKVAGGEPKHIEDVKFTITRPAGPTPIGRCCSTTTRHNGTCRSIPVWRED